MPVCRKRSHCESVESQLAVAGTEPLFLRFQGIRTPVPHPHFRFTVTDTPSLFLQFHRIDGDLLWV